MAIFIVSKEALREHPDLETEVASLCCKNKIENETHVGFEPKDGYLVTFGVLLTEKKISYTLEFDSTNFHSRP